MSNQPTCDKCGTRLTAVEAAGRETGTCNDCLRKRQLRRLNREIALMRLDAMIDQDALASLNRMVELRDMLKAK
jgi:hypothetical protein